MDEDSFLNKESSESSIKNRPDHWFWSNWILLSLGAAVCFTVGDLMLGSLQSVGLVGNYYFGAGSLLVSAIYFLQKSCSAGPKKEFLHNSLDRSFRWNVLFWMTYCAFTQTLIQSAIMLTFTTSYMSNLNPGIAMTIWNVVPFLLALADRVLWHAKLQAHNVVGMVLMVLCGCAISLSNLLNTEVQLDQKPATLGTYVPVLVAVACAFCLVLCIVGMKYATVYLHVDPHDFNYGMYGIQGVVL
jgi:hypothetical protein